MDKPKRMEDLPPAIQEALKKRGWMWPLSDEVIGERVEASKRVVPMKGSLEVLRDMAEEDGNWDAVRYYEEQIRKREEQKNSDACGTTDVS